MDVIFEQQIGVVYWFWVWRRIHQRLPSFHVIVRFCIIPYTKLET